MTDDTRNVALVVLDTLRKDRFDEQFDWLPGRRFENAWSTSHWTVPSHASLFTGRYGSEVGCVAGAETLDTERRVLAERLSAAGYRTRAFSGNVNVSPQFRYDRGFDEFEGSWRLRSLDENLFDWDGFIAETRDAGPERYLRAVWACVTGDCDTVRSIRHGAAIKLRDLGLGPGVSDDGAQRAAELVEDWSFGDREFLFVNLMEAHTPYDAPEAYRTVDAPELRGLEMTFTGVDGDASAIRQAYDDEVRYLADVYRRIFARLREAFDVVITVSDHGELLGEHGVWEHMIGVYPEVTHVPVTVWTGGDEVVTDDTPVSLLDVYTTVCAAAGVDPGDVRGRDLRGGVADDREWLTEYHGISQRHHQSLADRDITDVDHLFESLAGLAGRDFYVYETFDGVETVGDAPGDATDRLASVRDSLDRRAVSETEELDEAVLDQLRDLGYA